MSLNTKWWANSGTQVAAPFKDNDVGGITAASLREFAEDINLNGLPAEWFLLESGPINEALPDYVTDFAASGTAMHVWFAETGSSIARSSGFQTSLDADPSYDAHTMEYVGGGTNFIHVTITSSDIDLSGIRNGTEVRPVVWLGTAANTGVVYSAGSPLVTTTSDTAESLDLTSSTVLPLFTQSFVRLGIRLTPPGATTVADGSPSINFNNSSGLVMARPAAAEAP